MLTLVMEEIRKRYAKALDIRGHFYNSCYDLQSRVLNF